LTKRFCNLAWFLREVCGEEERNLILHTLLPAMASLALSLRHNKPFLGEHLHTLLPAMASLALSLRHNKPFLGEHLHTLLPAMASLALSLPHNKPFLGEQYVQHTAEETFPW
jgi:hypothetical protein